MSINEQLRADAAAHVEKHIDMHSILYRQGREIAQTYVRMMMSYARLDVQSGHYTQLPETMAVNGFCRIEERHFEKPLLKRTRKQSFWTSQWAETVTLQPLESDLWDAFLSGMGEICRREHIQLGELCALVRTKNGTQETRKLPVKLTLPEFVEAIGFPYQIAF